MSLVLPYTDFLPDTVHVGLVFKVSDKVPSAVCNILLSYYIKRVQYLAEMIFSTS